MATLAQGQITLVDYTDGSQITGQLSVNTARVQTFNPDNGSRVPSWESLENKLIITPFFRRSGTGGLATILSESTKATSVKSVSWYIGTSDKDEPNRFPGGTKITDASHNGVFKVVDNVLLHPNGPKYALQIRQDILKNSEFSVGSTNNVMSITIVCEVIEKDPVSGQDNVATAEVDLSVLVQGGSVAAAICSAPQGNIFKNDSIATLPATCTLYMASVVDSSASYQWYVQETGAKDDENAIAKGIPGPGWKKLVENYSLGTSGWNGPTLTIPASAVPSLESFMCIIEDNETEARYFDTITFIDASDPYQVTVLSSNGLTFKRGGAATTEVSAVLYQNGTQIDAAGTKYDYLWSKRKDGGAADSSWVPVYKNPPGKNVISITTADIANKATFTVEVKPKK